MNDLKQLLISENMIVGISAAKWDEVRTADEPSSDVIKNRYGGWPAFVEAHGLTPASRRKSIRRPSKIIAFKHYRKRIRGLSQSGIAPTADQWDAQRRRNEYNADSLSRILGLGWPKVVELCGLKPAHRGIPEDYVYSK